MRTGRAAAIATALFVLSANPASAAPGGPDPSFGRGGWVYADHGELDLSTAIVRTPDNRVVVAAMSITPGRQLRHSFHLTRYLPNGRVDGSFGSRGVARPAIGDIAIPADLLQRPDGRLVVAASTVNGTDAMLLVGVTANGRPDPAFGRGGKTVVPVTGGQPMVYDADLASDGSIAVAGTVESRAGSTAFVQRFLPNGTPDTSFAPAGRVVVATAGRNAVAYGVVTEPSGALVVAGTTEMDRVGAVPFLVRLLPNGLQDPTFGSAAMTNLPATEMGRLVRTANGSFVVVGYRPERGLDGGPDVGVIARFLPTGTLDPAFGTTGVLTVKAGSASFLNNLTLLDDGRIVAVGGAARRTLDILLVRLDALGRLDTAYGTKGAAVHGHPSNHELAASAVGGPGGAVTVTGITFTGRGFDGVTARFLG